MRNIKLTLQYDGSDFCGYEKQKNGRSIRAEIEKALQTLFKQPFKIIGTSRTDAGVHACCQVINFKTSKLIPIYKMVSALNSFLPEEIRIIKAEEKDKEYSSRFAVKSKEYEYLIYNGAILNPIFKRFVWHVRPKLNIAAMKMAAKYLVGKHDFSSFCAAHCEDKDRVRIIQQLVIRHSTLVIWKGCKLSAIRIKFVGPGFLYKMVRNIVGTLVEVGLGIRKYTEMERILTEKDRKKAGRTAPAQGLCLVKVNF